MADQNVKWLALDKPRYLGVFEVAYYEFELSSEI